MKSSIGVCSHCGMTTLTPSNGLNTATWLCGPPPAKGQKQRFPSRFDFYLKAFYPEVFTKSTLVMFSGSVEWGITTDIRDDSDAMIIAPFEEIPFDPGTFDCVIADPPYANHYAEEWHVGLPKPKHILREAAKLVKAGGIIMILHIILIPAYKEYGVERIAIHPVLCGPSNAFRGLNVFRKVKGNGEGQEDSIAAL